MLNTKIRLKVVSALSALILVIASPVFSQEDAEYRKFKLEDASCDVGVRYKRTKAGLAVGVSAIATGKGSEFRKWSVTYIKLRMGEERIAPDKESKFYVTEESFFRVPGAVIFAAIGAFGEYGGNNFNNNFSKVGMALGLGLIALQAKGQISGQRCVFYIPPDIADKIKEGKDSIEIGIENEGTHLKDTIKIGLIRPSGDMARRYNFKDMDEGELSRRMDSLKERIISLEQEQGGYKYGRDPEYDAIQKRIEALETERGLAYEAWFEKKNGPDNI